MNGKPGEIYIFFPDAMKDEIVYKIVGKAMNQAEIEASRNVVTQTLSPTREGRLKLFRWPSKPDSELLAILQYDFPGANPAMPTPSLGVLAHAG